MSVVFLQRTGIAIDSKVLVAILEFKRLRSAAGFIFFFRTLKDEHPISCPATVVAECARSQPRLQ